MNHSRPRSRWWNGHDLPLIGVDYRVRYCASGMNEKAEQSNRFDADPECDRHLLRPWPGTASPARAAGMRSTGTGWSALSGANG